MQDGQVWQVGGGRALRLDRPRIAGVLNVTPDSFSDGGACEDVPTAVARALQMIEEGACVIDVGGESTRPGAARVAADLQVARTVPVIEALRRRCNVLISIDTTQVEVAEASLDAGADIINDVSAGTEDARMLDLAAGRGCGLVLMHRRVPPQEDSYSDRYASAPEYADVATEVRGFLEDRCREAVAAGVDASALVIDPGLGFGKTVEQNFQLIHSIRSLVETGYPVLSAASRKSFLGAVTGVTTPSDRVSGSTAVSVIHYLAGVRLFRVHDVAAHREALDVAAGSATMMVR